MSDLLSRGRRPETAQSNAPSQSRLHLKESQFARAVTGDWIRWVLLAGAVAIIGVGASWARATVAGPHFEGYAPVLGSAMVVQGALTIAWLLPPVFTSRSSKGVQTPGPALRGRS